MAACKKKGTFCPLSQIQHNLQLQFIKWTMWYTANLLPVWLLHRKPLKTRSTVQTVVGLCPRKKFLGKFQIGSFGLQFPRTGDASNDANYLLLLNAWVTLVSIVLHFVTTYKVTLPQTTTSYFIIVVIFVILQMKIYWCQLSNLFRIRRSRKKRHCRKQD